MTDEQRDILQVLYHEYRQTLGDHKLDYHPFHRRPERMRGFAQWIKTVIDDDLLREVESNQITTEDEE